MNTQKITPSIRDSGVKDQRLPSVLTNKLHLKLKKRFFTKYPVALKNIDLAEKNLGDSYYLGRNGIIQNLSEAIKIYTIQASEGNHYAQFRLGYCYNHGEGVAKNILHCIRLYLMAAENDNPLAQAHLGDLYFKGIEVPKDMATAISYYTRSECPYGDYCLALCYFNGSGVAKNKRLAALLWNDAANKGLAEAQYYMGVMYETGEIVVKNYKTAVYWYNRSSKQGFVPSIERLAHCYTHGFGVRMNKRKAIEMYKTVNVNVTLGVSKQIYEITSSIDAHNEDT